MPTLAKNKYARSDYDLIKELEGGLMLTGAEVKAAKLGHIRLKGSFLSVENGELWVKNMHISPYGPAVQEGYDPTHKRKVLVHKAELRQISQKKNAEGLTIVPISVYTKGDLVKLGFAIARGKKKYEKRQDIKKRDIDRKIRQELKK
jgi:SsrA-binding protein